ncbi:MAG: oligosaccharide flippase family protein [Hyphomicrobiales bacterium]|nr:oligosaccharide flippase family protein [Hyphomicrobiales bacterium]
MDTIFKTYGRISYYLRSNRNIADAAITLIVRILAALLAYGVHVLIARFLAMEQYGIYVTMWTWLVVAHILGVFGFSESCLRFLPRYTQRKQYHWAIGFLKTGFWFSTLGAAFVGVAGLLTIWAFKDTISPAYLFPLIMLVIALPIMSVELYLEGISRAFGWYLLTTIPAYAIRPVLIAIGVLIANEAGYTLDAALVLALVAGSTTGIVIVQIMIILKRIRKKFGSLEGGRPRKFWVTSTLPLLLYHGVDELYNWSDILILGFMTPAPEVAIYFAAQRSMSLASFIQYAFMLVSAREFSIANAMRDRNELQRRISTATRWTFWMTVPAVALTFAVGYPLLHMFGPEFVPGIQVMGVLGLGLIIRASVGQASDLLVVLGHQYANMLVSAGGLVFNIMLSIILIPSFGILGAAMATSVTYALRAVALTVITRKLTGLWVLADLPVLKPTVATNPNSGKVTPKSELYKSV